MKKIIILLIYLGSFSVSFAKDEKKDPDKMFYTEKEFQEALMKEVNIKLKKVKNGAIVEFSKELLEKEYQLKLKNLNLKKREEEFTHTQKDFEKQVISFNSKQKNFLVCIDKEDKKEKKKVQHIVDAFSSMKPDVAAQVLSVQDPIIAIKILELLSSKKVSKIFNKMDKEISARLQKQFMTMKR